MDMPALKDALAFVSFNLCLNFLAYNFSVVTTMGVGELSALNGIAGAYTEHVKVIHIVGTTPTHAHEKHLMIHHSLGLNPDHRVGSDSLLETDLTNM